MNKSVGTIIVRTQSYYLHLFYFPLSFFLMHEVVHEIWEVIESNQRPGYRIGCWTIHSQRCQSRRSGNHLGRASCRIARQTRRTCQTYQTRRTRQTRRTLRTRRTRRTRRTCRTSQACCRGHRSRFRCRWAHQGGRGVGPGGAATFGADAILRSLRGGAHQFYEYHQIRFAHTH